MINILAPAITRIEAHSDLKAVRRSPWFGDVLDLVNWFGVSDRPLTPYVRITVIPDLMERILLSDIGGRQLRADIWRRLSWLKGQST